MIGNALNMLGIKITDSQRAKVSAALEQLPSFMANAQKVLNSLALEHGALSQPVKPHDPLKLPYRHVCTGNCEHDLVTELGKPVTLGSIHNIGAERVTVRIFGVNDQMSEFPLIPGATEDTSSYVYERLQVIGAAGSEVLITAQ